MSDFDNGASDGPRSARAPHDEGIGAGGNAIEDAFCNGGKRRSDTGGPCRHSRGSIFDALFGDEDDDESDIAFDIEMESFFRGLHAIEARLSHAIEELFSALMSRSMGRANFVAVTFALLICTRVIGAVFIDADALCELNALAFAVSVAVLVVCAISEKCPANALSAIVIACLPALIEIVTTCTVHGSDADVFVRIMSGMLLGIGAGAALAVVLSLVSDCEDEDVACARILVGPLWGAVIGTTAALVCDIAPYIAREIAFGVDPLYVSYLELESSLCCNWRPGRLSSCSVPAPFPFWKTLLFPPNIQSGGCHIVRQPPLSV